MKVLVTGGAGYIGSITAQELVKKGHEAVIFDSLQKGHREAVKGLDLVIGETQDDKFLVNILKDKKIEAVIHFAAFIEMEESYQNPYKYFYNNVYGSLQLFKAMVKSGVKKLVFSSTAGVYGNLSFSSEVATQNAGTPRMVERIKEDDPKKPENPYGESKLMVENILKWFDKAYGLKSISLRYFNAAGAALDQKLGEDHQPESHLIPNILKALLGQKRELVLYGHDYQTPDKTCIRDYIHVLDLASAHILALEALVSGQKSDVYNLGAGKGYSNLEVVEMAEKVSAQKAPLKFGPRRPGDADRLIADSSKIQKELGWKPCYSDLETMVKTAWQWHQANPQGFENLTNNNF